MWTMFNWLSVLVAVCVHTQSSSAITPVVLYHGIGDTYDGSPNGVKTYLEQSLPGIYVLSVQMGDTSEQDKLNSYFLNLNTQVKRACEIISADPNLQKGYNAIGFSQGGQIVRGIIQRCPSPPVFNYISMGGQQQGVFGLPNCVRDLNSAICGLFRRLINLGVYLPFVQATIVPAQYWHDPHIEALYRSGSTYLADINNERTPRNETYRLNLLRLTNLVLVQFLNDTTVQPRESEWFEFYKPGLGPATEIVPLRQSAIYTEDRIGLKQLDESGRLKFVSLEGDHLVFTLDWFQANIVAPYLNNSLNV